MNLYPELRRRVRQILDQAGALDQVLAQAQALDTAIVPALVPIKAARALLDLDEIADRLEALTDGLGAELRLWTTTEGRI